VTEEDRTGVDPDPTDAARADAQDIVVAIDGPAGSGKSTVSRLLAERVGFRSFDTGAIYRAVTFALLREGVRIDDSSKASWTASTLHLTLEPSERNPSIIEVRLGGMTLGHELRSDEVNLAVPLVASVPTIRRQLLSLQRSVLEKGKIVAEGRDIGSTVWPDAQVKIFLTAAPNVRAARRSKDPSSSESKQSVKRRDDLDRGQMVPASDAIVIDSTVRSVGDITSQIEQLVVTAQQRRPDVAS
jgi:cytidylate kinase